NGSGKLDGKDITVNAGGNISLLNIVGDSVVLNAGYPEHTVFGKPGTVTLTNLTITADLTIWCMSVLSLTGTKNITGNVELNTDNTDAVDIFLTYFNISGTSDNKLRSGVTGVDYEFGPADTKNCFWIDSSGIFSPWPLILPSPGDGFNVYITGSITALGDLTINTTSGDIIFEGDYDADDYLLNLNTTGGKIKQSAGTITVNKKITVNVKGGISQNDGKITAGELYITAGEAVILAQNNEVQKLTVLSTGGDVEFKNPLMKFQGLPALMM
ncbi:hypothetical protein, partial [Treponema sp. R80B11-R83G3]